MSRKTKTVTAPDNSMFVSVFLEDDEDVAWTQMIRPDGSTEIVGYTIIPKREDPAAADAGASLSPQSVSPPLDKTNREHRSEFPSRKLGTTTERAAWAFRIVRGRVVGKIEICGEFPFEDLARLRSWPTSGADVERMSVADDAPMFVHVIGLGAIAQAGTPDPQIVYFTATGAGSFPLDMLRYCRCWPATVRDARALSLNETRARAVTLAGLGPLAPERWNSFSWRITGAASRPAPSNARYSV